MSTRQLPAAFVHATALVDPTAQLGAGTKVWHLAQVREGAVLGKECVLGKGAYVGEGVHIGDRVKIQNNASVYEGSTLEDGVFIGPHVCLTNDRLPRAVTPDGALKTADDWELDKIVVRTGAAIGAGSVIVTGVTIGRWALVGAGAVVTRDVPDFGLVLGNPARLAGYVCRCATRLTDAMVCPRCGRTYTGDQEGIVSETEPATRQVR